jgi:hypothetical protein
MYLEGRVEQALMVFPEASQLSGMTGAEDEELPLWVGLQGPGGCSPGALQYRQQAALHLVVGLNGGSFGFAVSPSGDLQLGKLTC